jgi:hypothetical protein
MGTVASPAAPWEAATTMVAAAGSATRDDTVEETLTEVDDLMGGPVGTSRGAQARTAMPPPFRAMPALPSQVSQTSHSTLAQIQIVKKAVRTPTTGIVETSPSLVSSFDDQTTMSRNRDFAGPGPTAAAPGPVVFEITPQALGIATIAGYCEHVIKRNASLPHQAVRVFATSRDHQRTVRLRVCQGNARKFADNTTLGDLVIDDLPAGPRGTTQIEVTFSLDVSGRLHVVARDPETGREQQTHLEVIGAQSGNDLDAASQRLRTMRT